MTRLNIAHILPRGRWAPLLATASLIATVAVAEIATSLDALALTIVGVGAVLAVAIAAARPNILFYVYVATIPLNFALPPGPAGTIARIAGIAFFVGYLVRRPNSLHPSVVPLAGWLFVAWALASSIWSIDAQTAYSTWLSVAQLFAVTVLIASVVADEPQVLGKALWSYTISATLTGVVGILVYLAGATSSFGRATSFANQDPALFASVILPAAVFLMGEAQSRTIGPVVRLLAFAGLLICVTALAVSGTRSAWVGMVAAVAIWLVLERKRRQLVSVGAVLVGILILVVAIPGVQDFLLGRAATSVSTGGSGRTDIWGVGLSIFLCAPLIGVGFGNFPVAFTSYAITQATGLTVGGALTVGRASHNVLLGTSVETGIIGACLLVAFFVATLVRCAGDRGTVLRAAVISLLVQAMFLDILEQKQLWLFAAFALGAGAASRAHAVADGAGKMSDRRQTSMFRLSGGFGATSMPLGESIESDGRD